MKPAIILGETWQDTVTGIKYEVVFAEECCWMSNTIEVFLYSRGLKKRLTASYSAISAGHVVDGFQVFDVSPYNGPRNVVQDLKRAVLLFAPEELGWIPNSDGVDHIIAWLKESSPYWESYSTVLHYLRAIGEYNKWQKKVQA